MKIHKAGWGILIWHLVILTILNFALFFLFDIPTLSWIFFSLSVFFMLVELNFYRNPTRHFDGDSKGLIISSADGKVVAIEEVYEAEYFKDNRLLVSVFMSPLNVHANWYPINGTVLESIHHNGRYLAAYLPKSSTENERSTVVIETEDKKHKILLRQIAGAMARRIVTYPKAGSIANVDEHLGFIKLGSRVDLYLPLGTEVLVELDQKVEGNQTIIGKFQI